MILRFLIENFEWKKSIRVHQPSTDDVSWWVSRRARDRMTFRRAHVWLPTRAPSGVDLRKKRKRGEAEIRARRPYERAIHVSRVERLGRCVLFVFGACLFVYGRSRATVLCQHLTKRYDFDARCFYPIYYYTRRHSETEIQCHRRSHCFPRRYRERLIFAVVLNISDYERNLW